MIAEPSCRVKAAIERGVSRQRVSQLRHPDRNRARAAVAKALKSGRLERPDSCSRCDSACKPESHHGDYSAPLEVEWLCRPCHRIADAEMRPKTVDKSGRAVPAPETLEELLRQGPVSAARQLRAVRQERRWGQRRMALYLGVDPSWIAKVEAEVFKPGRTLANRIQALLGVPTTAWDNPADLLPQDGSADAAA